MANTDWQRHIHNQPHSGLTVPKYCAMHGIQSSQFYKIRKRLKGEQTKPSFAAVDIKPSEVCPHVELRIELVGDEIRFKGSSNHQSFLSAFVDGLRP